MEISTVRFAALGLTMTLLAACGTTTQFSLPGNRFDLPQTLDKGQYSMAVENATATEVEIFQPGTSYAPRIDNPELTNREGLVGLRFARGMSDKVELQLQTLPFMSSDTNGFPGLKAKYRLSENGALTAGIAFWDKENRTYGNPNYYNDMQVLVLDFAGIAGWHAGENWQVYGGPWLTWAQYGGEWRRESFGIVDMKDNFSGSASEVGVNLGLAWQLGHDWSLLGEVAASRIEWQDSEDENINAGLQLRKIIR